jgi:hypothetical protein
MSHPYELAKPGRAARSQSGMNTLAENISDCGTEPLEQSLVLKILTHAQVRLLVSEPGQPRLEGTSAETA